MNGYKILEKAQPALAEWFYYKRLEFKPAKSIKKELEIKIEMFWMMFIHHNKKPYKTHWQFLQILIDGWLEL